MSDRITIRQACAEDATSITALVDEAYAPYITRIGRKPGPMLEDYRQVIDRLGTFVMTDAEQVIGVLVMEQEGNELLLANVAVLPAYKGQGIGKALMAFCERHALAAGCASIRLYTHVLMTENIGIYGKLGYAQTHRAREDGFDRVYMRKLLNAPSS